MKKTRLIFSIVMVLALMTAVLAFAGTAAGANSVFEAGSFYEITENFKSDLVVDGKSGTLIKTSASEQPLKFKSSLSGEFEVEFRPLAQTTGVDDFSTLNFFIRSDDSRYGLQLYYQASSFTSKGDYKAPTYGVRLDLPERVYGWSSEAKTSETGSSNTGEIGRMGFNPDTMEVYCIVAGKRTVIVDLDSAESLAKAQFNTSVIFKGFSTYNVEMTFTGVTSSASVIIYSINGQSLSGANSAGAVIVGSPKISNAVAGKEYVIPAEAIRTYDFRDGFKDDFKGEIKALAPSGKEIVLTNGKFTPTEIGKHKLTITAEDSEGMKGPGKQYDLNVLAVEPAPVLTTSFPLENMSVARDTLVYFPSAKAESKLDLYNEAIKPVLTITKGGQTVTSMNAENYTEYMFTADGDYTVTISATDIYGNVASESATVKVSSSTPYFEFTSKFESEQVVGTVFTIPTVMVQNGKVTTEVEFPDGRRLSANCFELDVLGVYKIKFSANVGGKTYTYVRNIVVERTSASLLTSYSAITSEHATAPDYAADVYKGVKITGSRAMSTARWANIINLKDNTLNDILINFFVMPEEQGIKEYSQFLIRMTDANDPSRVVNITFTEDSYADDYIMKTAICANKDGIYTSVASLRMSPYGAFNSKYYGWYPAIDTKLYFDWESNTLYGSLPNQNNTTATKTALVKLDDESKLGAGNGFAGFTTGEIYLDVAFMKLASSSPDMLIMNVDGQDLSTKYVEDTTEPFFCVDYDGNEENNLPKGIVGTDYPLFKAVARDTVSGLCASPDIKIYYYDADGSRSRYMNFTETTFIPDKEGTYSIEYTAYDAAGNKGVKEVMVEIVGEGEIPEITYDWEGVPATAYTGAAITVPKGTASGGSGILKETLTVTLDGEHVKLDGRTFMPTDSGDYFVEVKIVDYLKNEKVFSGTITISANPYPVLVEATVPYAVIAKRGITFAPWTAYDYSSGEQKTVNITVKAKTKGAEDSTAVALGADLKWNPDTKGTYELIFTATNNVGTPDERTSEIRKEIEVLDLDDMKGADSGIKLVKPGKGATDEEKAEYERLRLEKSRLEYLYMRNYFVRKDAYITSLSATDFVVHAEKDGASIAFANTLPADGFLFSFTVPEGQNGFNSLKITLTDSVNPAEVMTFDIRKEIMPEDLTDEQIAEFEYSPESIVYVNGSEKEILGSFHNVSNTPFTINYDNTTFVVTDQEGNTVTKVDKKEDGTAWTGFGSGKVYMKVEFLGYESASSIKIVDVCGQTFGNRPTDAIFPTVLVPVAIPAEYGEKLIVPAASAYDVLSELVKFTVTVKSPSGAVLTFKDSNGTVVSADNLDATKTYEFDVTEYGNYRIEYYAEDSAGQKTRDGSKGYVVNVRDKIPPTLTITGEIPLVISAETELTLPTATISDNRVGGSAKLYVWWVTPNGRMLVVGEDMKIPIEYTKVKGKHKVVYYGVDVDGYTTTQEYTIMVQ